MANPYALQIVVETQAFITAVRASVSNGNIPPRMSEQLARLLGCPFVCINHVILRANHEPCDAEVRSVRQRALSALFPILKKHSAGHDFVSLLPGLHRAGGWRYLLSSTTLAYDLAGALILFVERYTPVSDTIYAFAEQDVLGLMNAWLRPAAQWEKPPGVRTLCAHLFGEAWCALTLPETYADRVGGSIFQAIGPMFLPGVHAFIKKQSIHPELLPGLCPAQDQLANTIYDTLPEFG
jgi:hypothetical protein